MAWDRKPINGADIQAWYFVRQFYRAIQEKFCAVGGNPRWPAYNLEYDTGTIGAISSTTLTDSTKNWASFPSGCSGISRWYGVSCIGSPNTAAFYDVVIEAGGTNDETMIVRAQITGGTATTITFADTIQDYVTAGIISSLSDLVGKRYAIIKRDGLYWADKDDGKSRWPSWPNGFPSQAQIAAGDKGKQELWHGTATSGRAFSLTEQYDLLTNQNTVQFVAGTKQHWAIDRWKNQQLLVYRSDGYLARLTITGNSPATIFFGPCEYKLTVGGTIEVGDRFSVTVEAAVGSASVAIGAASTSATTTAAAIAAAINASTDPVFANVDASSSGATITLTATDPALWFIPTPSTTEADGNDADGQTFTLDDPLESDVVPAGVYSVMEPGGRGFPGRRPTPAGWWYGGYQESYWTHFPDDSIGALKMPVATVRYAEGTPPDDCEDVDHAAFDVDVYIPLDNECAEQGGDVFLAPHLFKTRRALQIVIRGLIENHQWAAPELFAGNPKTHHTLATAFYYAGINAQSTTISAVSSGVGTIAPIQMPKPTPASAAPSSMDGYFAVMGGDGSVLAAGVGTFTSTTLSAGLTSDHVGKTVLMSWGESGFHPRWFHKLYGQSVFIPDVDLGEGGLGVIDPAVVVDLGMSGCFGVGQWIHREPSGSYLERNDLGFFGEGGQPFLHGEHARYVGSFWALPDTGLGGSQMTDKVEGAMQLDLPYWDHFTYSRHLPAVQAIIDGAMTGSASAGGTNWLRDDTKNWYTSVWYSPNGVMRTESGTASGGSTTRIVDTSKTSGAGDPSHCLFDAGRFVGFAGAYVGFPIRITQTRGGATTVWRSVVTSTAQSPTQTTIDFRAVAGMPAVQAGDTYDIDEPYELNRWQRRTLRITKASGAVIETPILWNDDRTLFFDDLDGGAMVEAHDSWKITEIPLGSVPEWDEDGQTWIELTPGDPDPRGPSPGRSDDGIYVSPSSFNLPTAVRTFGPAMVADYSGIQFVEMYAMLNLLYKTIDSFSWTNNGEDNHKSYVAAGASKCGHQPGFNGWSDVYDFLNGTAWPGTSNDPVSERPHGVFSGSVFIGDPASGGIGADFEYMWAEYTNTRTCMARKVDLYNYATWTPTITLGDFGTHGSGWVRHAYSEFDAEGYPVAENQWTLFASSGVNTDVTFLVGPFGDTDLPLPPEPPCPGDDVSEPAALSGDSFVGERGFAVTDEVAITDWSPGMKYLDRP